MLMSLNERRGISTQESGRIGGLIGGRARAEMLTAERLSQIAGRAGKVRWLLEQTWLDRACFVCDKFGRCEHRERAVDVAELIANGELEE